MQQILKSGPLMSPHTLINLNNACAHVVYIIILTSGTSASVVLSFISMSFLASDYNIRRIIHTE